MSRPLTVAAAQLGPVARNDSRSRVVDRLIALLHQAHDKGVALVVFPELVGSSRVDLQACKLEYSIVSPK